ncbi:1-acyl-sn-glycerol-3-phosphate acyltransferase [Kangiella profundi]|uniref:1-acyl-sn-glycerol-3-phosphate acyltransferase n=1 Tax=Kangiella profundi TaxID=1561924 RepID=A0A2K9AXS2_9GAMM|nr:lysophospholipid acyltransferase family protein [Kangiella profundi]AUD79951.1 1-acyl-sn-glycerol-3-phosphate acyltransferase [Kangiella profundi]GGE93893.1 acyltransferase [Kangiella profundi]
MFNKINYIWRVFATGLSFTTFGIGGLLLSLIVFPIIALFNRDPLVRKRKARYLIHRSWYIFIRFMQALGIFRFDLSAAKEQLEGIQGKIVIANHPTLIDVVALISLIPNADCVVKQGLWNNFFLKRVVRVADFINNDQDVNKLIQNCKISLQEGYNLVIFPEGTRTVPNKPIKLQRGAANIAIRCQTNLLPVIIDCDPTTLTKQEKWYQIPDRKAYFTMRVVEEIDITPFINQEKNESIAARRLTEHIKTVLKEEVAQNEILRNRD